MTQPMTSPFRLNRWENEDARHYYYLNTSDFKVIRESRKHCFVIGHRGTGKTSILKALNWRERRRGAAEEGTALLDAFQDGIVGCYFGLQYIQLETLDAWLRKEDDQLSHQLISTYLRGLWLEEAARATRDLRRELGMQSLAEEVEVLSGIWEEFSLWLPDELIDGGDPRPEHLSLQVLITHMAKLSSFIFNAANALGSSPGRAASVLSMHRLPSLVNEIFLGLAKLLPSQASDAWVFQMCIDEGEYLSGRGKSTIRTMVRECTSPLLMTVASLDDLGVETLNPNVRLTVHDRIVLDLRKRTINQFAALIDGIVNERLKSSVNGPYSFSIKRLLGEYSLDQLLLASSTERPSSRRQILQMRDQSNVSDRSFIVEYLVRTGSVRVPLTVGSLDRFDERLQKSAGVRKKSVAGYLNLLAELGVKEPTYAGYTKILRAMENSLRDVFILIEHCFQHLYPQVEVSEAVPRFLGRQGLPIRTQDAAFKALSVRKMAGLDDRIVTLTSISYALVEFLSRLSHHLDMNEKGGAITRPERTYFAFTIPDRGKVGTGDRREKGARVDAIVAAVSSCTREGYLVGGVDPRRPDELVVRVNRTLAKLHGFSYRLPQYTTSVPWSILERVVDHGSEGTMAELTSEAVRALTNTRPLGSSKMPAQASTEDSATLFSLEEADE